MIFVFGLVLLIIGIPLGLYKEEVITYSSYSFGGSLGNIRVPTGTKDVFKFQPLALLLMVVGLMLIITGIVLAQKDDSIDKPQIEEVHTPNEQLW